MPYYGEENQKNQWWNGKTWVNYPQQQDEKGNHKHMLAVLNYARALDEKNCHVDGAFKCPACWLPHNTFDNYDLLCDGCVKVQSHQAPSATREEIALWQEMAALWWKMRGTPANMRYTGERLRLMDLHFTVLQNARDMHECNMKAVMVKQRIKTDNSIVVKLNSGHSFLLEKHNES